MLEMQYISRVIPSDSETWNNYVSRNMSTKVLSGGSHSWERVNPKEVISKKAKSQIFGTAAATLRLSLQSDNLILPEDNLIDRLMVVNSKDYLILSLTGTSDPGLNSLGARLPNRLCIANANAIAKNAKELSVNFEDLLCVVGTHEIAHTLTYQESWLEIMDGRYIAAGDKWFRRDGLISSKPPNFRLDQRRIGLGALNEGLMNYFTYPGLSSAQQELVRTYSPYSAYEQAIGVLADQIGREALVKAAFTKQGFRKLYQSVEEKYGPGRFNQLLNIIAEDSNQPLLDRLKESVLMQI